MADETRRRGARIAAAILAGGKATRYGGVQKALLEAEPGLPFLAEQWRALREAGVSDIVISASDPTPFEPFGLRVVPDRRRDYGPLAGIGSTLREFRETHDAVLFAPCDMPGIRAREVTTLLNAFRDSRQPIVVGALADDAWRPLFAVLATTCLPQVTRAISEDRLRIRALWCEIGCEAVFFSDPAALTNINCPADLERWRRLRADRAQALEGDRLSTT